eukprot:4404687-Pleurochrysis_carterae.AAC.1
MAVSAGAASLLGKYWRAVSDAKPDEVLIDTRSQRYLLCLPSPHGCQIRIHLIHMLSTSGCPNVLFSLCLLQYLTPYFSFLLAKAGKQVSSKPLDLAYVQVCAGCKYDDLLKRIFSVG